MRTLMAAAMMVGLMAAAGAQDKRSDPTGTWVWTTERGGQKRETTLKLKLDGGKLTGTVGAAKGKEAAIEDGKVEGGEVTFTVTREVKDQKFVTKYKAKVDGDVMKGTAETTFGGKDRKQEFEAKRQKKDD